MNLIEAVKSGKRFKRKTHTLWNDNLPDTIYEFSYRSILADDWEIEERKIEITESEFDKALIEASQRTSIGGDLYQELKKRLFDK